MEVTCRIQGHFNEITFKKEFKSVLRYNGVTTYNSFECFVLQALNKHAPCEKKILRTIHIPNMTKALRRAITRTCQLETQYVKEKLLKMVKKKKKEGIHTANLIKKKGGKTTTI